MKDGKQMGPEPSSDQIVPDSRERLEADVQKHFTHRTSTAMWSPSANKATDWLSVSMEAVLGWLDRQAAITERHWMEICGANANANVELKRQIDDLTADAKKMGDQLYDMENLRDVLKAELDIAQEVSDGLRSSLDDVMAERNQLAEERDELLRESKEFEQTHMELPVDADGVPIRPGDVMEFKRGDLQRDGAVVLVGKELISFGDAFSYHAEDCHHVQPDTVESLLDEFADEVKRCCDDEVIVNEYAERIRKAVER